MRVDEVFKQAASQGTAPISFEMFPPKGELSLDTAHEVQAICASFRRALSRSPARPAARATAPQPPPSRI